MSACAEKDMRTPSVAVALSVCVCTSNRADDLRLALESLARLRIPGGRCVELIVVDNASTDATPDVLSAAAARFPFPLSILYEPIKGLGAARNCALRHARGAVIAWTDDDCVPAEDWIERILAHFDEDPTLEILTGRVELYDPSHYPITINTSLEPAQFDESSACEGRVLGCNMAFRRRLIERVGMFDPRFGAGAPLKASEETEFEFRALRAGCRIAYAPNALLYHNHKRTTYAQMIRLIRNYIYGNGALLTKHVLAGDQLAARWFYWRIRGRIRLIVSPTPDVPKRMDNVILLMELLAGGFAYLWFAVRGSLTPATCRDAHELGSASS
jgi:GT2 family glycosyltransferase